MTHSHLQTAGSGEIQAVPCADPGCPMRPCGCGPDERCFDCATDEELAAAIPPWPSMGGEEVQADDEARRRSELGDAWDGETHRGNL